MGDNFRVTVIWFWVSNFGPTPSQLVVKVDLFITGGAPGAKMLETDS